MVEESAPSIQEVGQLSSQEVQASSATFRRSTSVSSTASRLRIVHRSLAFAFCGPIGIPPHFNKQTMASSTPNIRSLYRRLLRELPITPSSTPAPRTSTSSAKHRSSSHQKLSSPSTIQRRIRETFAGTATASSDTASSQLQQAEQFIQYVQAQRMYATLIERYNPGMGMSEEERVRLTARKVGMDLPPEFYGKGTK